MSVLPFNIIAHRGSPSPVTPENTLPAFLRAIELGADAIELDVRLTADHVPVVYHYFYMEQLTTLSGAVFSKTWDEIRRARFLHPDRRTNHHISISDLEEVLQALAGKTSLEIEIKGPELLAVDAVVGVLRNHPSTQENIEVTSYEPMLLSRFGQLMPHAPTALNIPLSEPWMKEDVLAYTATQRVKLAGAQAVHLHASQLSAGAVSSIRSECQVHAWGINDLAALKNAQALGIDYVCTDNLPLALNFRNGNNK